LEKFTVVSKEKGRRKEILSGYNLPVSFSVK
jgi:hypothetical protein